MEMLSLLIQHYDNVYSGGIPNHHVNSHRVERENLTHPNG